MAAHEGSITRHLGHVKAGDPGAAEALWDRYFDHLLRLARSRLGDTPRGASDEEDVALSALGSFLDGARRGRFPKLDDRDDLWKILATITVRKACDLARHERARRPRSGRIVTGEETGRGRDVLALVAGRGPGPELTAVADEQCRRLFDMLGDDVLRRVALDRLAGWKDEEIAARLGCTRRTVLRKLAVIRNTWQKELERCRSTP